MIKFDCLQISFLLHYAVIQVIGTAYEIELLGNLTLRLQKKNVIGKITNGPALQVGGMGVRGF